MLKKFKIFIWTLILFGSVSCVDNDNIGPIEKVNFLQFDFPQGNALWDKEIEQIAKDWGMYIIYKNVDSTHLNRMWTIPYYTDPIMYVPNQVLKIFKYIWIWYKNGYWAVWTKPKRKIKNNCHIISIW